MSHVKIPHTDSSLSLTDLETRETYYDGPKPSKVSFLPFQLGLPVGNDCLMSCGLGVSCRGAGSSPL